MCLEVGGLETLAEVPFHYDLFSIWMLVYNDGWNTWLSIAWNCIMFPMIALHHKKPLMAYVASIAAVILILIFFPVHFK